MSRRLERRLVVEIRQAHPAETSAFRPQRHDDAPHTEIIRWLVRGRSLAQVHLVVGHHTLLARSHTGDAASIVLRARTALAKALTAEGKYAALHVSCEAGEAAQDDFRQAQATVLSELRLCARSDLPADLRPPEAPGADGAPDGNLLRYALEAWVFAGTDCLPADPQDLLESRELGPALKSPWARAPQPLPPPATTSASTRRLQRRRGP